MAEKELSGVGRKLGRVWGHRSQGNRVSKRKKGSAMVNTAETLSKSKIF